MLNANGPISNQDLSSKPKVLPTVKSRLSRLSIGVHSMPKTSESSLKLWFILGGVILVLCIIGVVVLLN